MIYGLQKKKKCMTRMIKAEEKKKEPYLMKIRSLVKAKNNCSDKIKELKNKLKIKKK